MAKNKLISKVQAMPSRKRRSWFDKQTRARQKELLELREWFRSGECQQSATAIAETIASDCGIGTTALIKWLKRAD